MFQPSFSFEVVKSATGIAEPGEWKVKTVFEASLGDVVFPYGSFISKAGMC